MTKRSTTKYMVLLSVIVLSIVGCSTVTYVSGSREVKMVATVKSNPVQQTQSLDQEGLITAHYTGAGLD